MYKFQPFYEERYYIVTIIDEFTPEECRKFHQNFINFTDKINFVRFGVVTDMREFKSMPQETQEIISEGIGLSLKLGFTCAGRVIHTATDEMIQKLREASLKPGFLAQYFTNIPDAIEYVKKTLSRYEITPVKTRSEVISLLEAKYPYYRIS